MNLLGLYRKIVGLIGMTVMGSVMTIIRFTTFGYGVDFNRNILAPIASRLILLFLGVRVKNYIVQPDLNVIYMFNHNSFLDLFLIPLLGLKKTRFIISEDVKSVLPLHFCNLGIDVLYIPTKKDPERRLAFFKHVTSELSENKYNVICSPEGQHTFNHGISKFNDGVFHMALASKTPIQCLFFDIPVQANPLESFDMKSCVIKIYAKDLIETRDWEVENLTTHKNETRFKFLHYYKETYGDYGDSDTRC
ncbi:MAG: 1-acyl-sn-glycerol-3-phosphate acyltransferase [Bacteriovoracaceae bacterium]|nr:1-acyl-sn-glycerol-3-phosphate acyltransferase [Bacteriovoracaceae bacterium]